MDSIIKEAIEGNQKNQSKKVLPPLCHLFEHPLKSMAITDHKSRFSLM